MQAKIPVAILTYITSRYNTKDTFKIKKPTDEEFSNIWAKIESHSFDDTLRVAYKKVKLDPVGNEAQVVNDGSGSSGANGANGGATTAAGAANNGKLLRMQPSANMPLRTNPEETPRILTTTDL